MINYETAPSPELEEVRVLLHRAGIETRPINNSHDVRCFIPNSWNTREVIVMHYVLEDKMRVVAEVDGKHKNTIIPYKRGARVVAETVLRRFMEMP